MRHLDKLPCLIFFLPFFAHAEPIAPPSPPLLSNQERSQPQQPLFPSRHTSSSGPSSGDDGGISVPFFAVLERTARLVDIAYCVGTTGVSPPFACVSRCADFPSLRLVQTWNTGVLLSDSCGYIAIDHGDGKLRLGGGRGAREGEIVVAFRGTYSITNTIVDLSTVPQEYVPYPGDDGDGDEDGDGPKCDNCTVHMGFMASWRNAREVVVPALRAARAKYPSYRVHLIGHSLGGAVAALAALELKLGMGWEHVLVTTFGEPRVGNDRLSAYVDAAFGLDDDEGSGLREEDLQYRRVTHAGDPVPLLPLTEWGYRAHAGEVYITKSGLPPAPEDLRLCRGDSDPQCMGGAETSDWLGWILGSLRPMAIEARRGWFPARFKMWQLFFAHRDYFWRLGLCVPGGDPADWGREKYNLTHGDGMLEPNEAEVRDL